VANKEIWRRRVIAWRASGQGADEFCAGKEFSPGSLRQWAWLLGLTRRRGGDRNGAAKRVPLARVVRVKSVSATGPDGGRMFIQIGRARVEVRPGVDESTLAMVMRILESRARAAEAQS
jgi:transposase